jgi:hypothetical protein
VLPTHSPLVGLQGIIFSNCSISNHGAEPSRTSYSMQSAHSQRKNLLLQRTQSPRTTIKNQLPSHFTLKLTTSLLVQRTCHLMMLKRKVPQNIFWLPSKRYASLQRYDQPLTCIVAQENCTLCSIKSTAEEGLARRGQPFPSWSSGGLRACIRNGCDAHPRCQDSLVVYPSDAS